MIKLRHLFFALVALNMLLLVVFMNMSLDSVHSASNRELPLTNFVTGGDFMNKLDSYNNDDATVYSYDTSDVDPTPAPEAPKLEKVDDSVKPEKQSENRKLTVTPKIAPIVSQINLKNNTLAKKPVAAPKEDLTKAVQALGMGSSDMSMADLQKLNAKVKNDPQLKQFINTFKRLKDHYNELNNKYTQLGKNFTKLQKSSNKLGEKHEQLRVWYDNKKRFYDNKVEKIYELQNRTVQAATVLRLSNPFYLMGAYPEVSLQYFNSYPDGRPYYNKWNYGLHNDLDYCEITDLYNLAHPENMFKSRNFFTDYAKNGLPRTLVMRKIGHDLSWKISKYMPKDIFYSRQFHLDPRINTFFTKRVDLHIYHEIGKHFLCATQQYNHIPGHGSLKRKDIIVDSVDAYAARYEDKPHCFNKHTFFPFSYRLYIKEECKTFFKEINSKAYKLKQKTEPIQYLLKVGYGAHRANGVFLLDQETTFNVSREYENGRLCGALNKSLIAQTYVTNPLLLDFNNKFDFRIYMLVASTNPLIAFYHDGFLRVSLNPYNKFSNDRSTHLTNTHLSKDIFAEVKEKNQTLNGMTEEELRNYQMWSLERLQDYLLRAGKITDPNWLDNYLRPKFREAFIHTIRMSAHSFWKGSNVFEMFGLDFMLDDELNLWFIECNSSPQLIGTNEHKTNFLVKMLKDLFEIQYAYYKSRMSRLLAVVKRLQIESNSAQGINYAKWRKEYQEAAKNRLEPEFQLKPTNGFTKIMDLNIKGPAAYFGNLRDECVDD